MSLKDQNIISASAVEQKSKALLFKVPDTLSRRYARAFYKCLAEQDLLAEVIPQVSKLKELFESDPVLSGFLRDLALNNSVREETLLKIAQICGCHVLFENFLKLIVQRGRLALLTEILEAVLFFSDKAQGIVPVRVITPAEMTDAQRQKLNASLEEMGCKSPRIFEEIDPSLLGGAVVQIGFQLYDTSLKGRINRLKNAFKGEV